MSMSLLPAFNREEQNYSNPVQSLVDDPVYAVIVIAMVSFLIIALVVGFLYSAFCSYPKYRNICLCRKILKETNKTAFKTVTNQETATTSNMANMNGLRIITNINSFNEMQQFPVSISHIINNFNNFDDSIESDEDEEAGIEKNTPQHYYSVIDVPEEDMATK